MPLQSTIKGRPRKPLEKQRLLGNPRDHKLPDPIVVPMELMEPEEPPEGLGVAGRAFWDRVWSAVWVSPNTDWAVVELLARAYDEMASLRRTIKDEGRFLEDKSGRLVSHPAVDQLRKVEEYVTKWLCLCGLTPSDKSRLGISEIKAVSKLEAFLGKHSGSNAS